MTITQQRTSTCTHNNVEHETFEGESLLNCQKQDLQTFVDCSVDRYLPPPLTHTYPLPKIFIRSKAANIFTKEYP